MEIFVYFQENASRNREVAVQHGKSLGFSYAGRLQHFGVSDQTRRFSVELEAELKHVQFLGIQKPHVIIDNVHKYTSHQTKDLFEFLKSDYAKECNAVVSINFPCGNIEFQQRMQKRFEKAGAKVLTSDEYALQYVSSGSTTKSV